jgi:hypothetical protein
MYGLKLGANTPKCCIYCNQLQSKATIGMLVDARRVMKDKEKYCWQHGLFSTNIEAKPIEGHERWKPIFSIPLEHVHICTMHCINRIIEKVVHLHFMQVWAIQDEAKQRKAIDDMQKAISLTGAHGRNVVIFKDDGLFGKSSSVPNKPSFSGAHAMKLFKNHPSSVDQHIPRKLYFDVVQAENNLFRGGEDRREKIELWSMLDDIRLYCQGLRLKEDQSVEDFKAKVEAWGRQFVKCFGEFQITHYMVSSYFLSILLHAYN